MRECKIIDRRRKEAGAEMAVKTIVSGKHPVIVRISPDDYRVLAIEAARKGVSTNEMIAKWVHDYVNSIRKEEP